MSGYFREPEPWEVAGGDTYSDDDDDHHHHAPRIVQQYQDHPDLVEADLEEEQDDLHGAGGEHTPTQSHPYAYAYEPAESLPSPGFPTHSRTPSQVGEVRRNGAGTTPLLESTSPGTGVGLVDSPTDTFLTSPSNPFSNSTSTSSGATQQRGFHRQLRGALGTDNRYPSLPSSSNPRRMSDLVDVSSPPPPVPIPVPGASATMPISGSSSGQMMASPSSPYGGIPRASAFTSDSYFPMLPPAEEFGRWSNSPTAGSPPEGEGGNDTSNGSNAGRRFRFGSSGSRHFFRNPST